MCITSNNNDRDLDRLFDDLNESDRKNLERVWDDSAKIDLDEPYISGDETEDALRNVHRKLGFNEIGNSEEKSNEKGLNNIRYYLAAAIVLIAAGGTSSNQTGHFNLLPGPSVQPR